MSGKGVDVCVKWCSLSTGISDLYVSQELCDLCLICSDGRLMAHKVVLSSVSHTFRSILANNRDMSCHSFVFFIDESVSDIRAIVDSIYFGRQSVPSNCVQRLTRIADSLGIQLNTAVNEALHSSLDPVFGDPEVLPKAAHQNRNQSKQKAFTFGNKKPKKRFLSKQLVQHFNSKQINDEKPLDLSNPEVVLNDCSDNSVLTSTSMAMNGKQLSNRRRKQTVPKQIAHKFVRFDDSIHSFEPLCELTEEISDENDGNDGNHGSDDNLLFNSSLISTTVSSVDQMIDQLMATSDHKIESNSEDFENKDSMSAQMSALDCDPLDPLNESGICLLCSQEFLKLKQLITHLNKNHRIDGQFECNLCSKMQKYAKTFAQHLNDCHKALVFNSY